MIILDKEDEILDCSCGTRFIASPKDFKLWSTDRGLIKFTTCPKCSTTHSVLYYGGSEVIEIEKEKKDD